MIDAANIIQGIKPPVLTPDERASTLIRRSWTSAERRVVLHGFFGRLTIAIEPALCGLVFAAITAGVFLAPQLSPAWVNPDLVVIAPIFGLGVIASAVYAIAVMLGPARALVHTLKPIYVVDGYVRYRRRDAASPADSNGYIAVLTEDRRVACEWPTLGEIELVDLTRPALCEFTEYGGIHRIDGRGTGVLPDRVPALGVGGRSRRGEYR